MQTNSMTTAFALPQGRQRRGLAMSSVGWAEAAQADRTQPRTYTTAPLMPARAACGDRGWERSLEDAWGLLPLQHGDESRGAPTFEDVRQACALQAVEAELAARWPLPRHLVQHILSYACPVPGIIIA